MESQHIQNKEHNKEIVVYRLSVGQLATNCYILVVGEKSYVIDPGGDGTYIAETLLSLQVIPQAIFLTHGHFDHMLGAFEVSTAFNIPTYVSHRDTFLVERMQQTAEHFLKYAVDDIPPKPLFFYEDAKLRDATIRVIHTPGHTPGSICLEVVGFPALFTGDTIFAGGFVGETNHAYSSKQELQKSLTLIHAFDEHTVLFPGHGESTTLYDIHHINEKELV